MQLSFDISLAEQYKSRSQAIRVMTESWVRNTIFCPGCGQDISEYPNNNPVGDFFCSRCSEDYELKSKSGKFTGKVVDGAYRTMIQRLESDDNPNFFLLNYNPDVNEVTDLAVIPRHFFTPKIIERRKPLSVGADRANWVGCNILIRDIPNSGKIFYVRGGQVNTRKKVMDDWQRTLFLRETGKPDLRGWTLDVMKCIDDIGKSVFSLDDVYAFEPVLSKRHVNNRHIRDKIRQQLQVLRDGGYLEFVGRGTYRLI
ncbi:restriction endonuclease [Candidatus Uhrbacteria bacterium]|nr:restriction endonuclease [Candidatus Uhrbacteria bacterium]